MAKTLSIKGTIVLQKNLQAFNKKDNRFIVDQGGSRSSKCLGKDTKVLMYDGSLKYVQDIVVGDKLMGIDSTPRKVLKLYQGRDQLYWIRQARGVDYKVSRNHILSIKETTKEKRKSVTVSYTPYKQKRVYIGHENPYTLINISLQDYMKKSKRWKRRYKGWKIAGVAFKEKKLNIDPYFIGYWLGDGTCGSANVTTAEKEIVKYLKSFSKKYNTHVVKIKCDKYGYALSKNKGTGKTNEIKTHLKYYGILKNKRIPQDFLINSYENRMQLLAGLIDSDGYTSKSHKGTCIITQIRKALAEDILFLVRSLGFYATFKCYDAKMKRKDGTVYVTKSYKVEFSGGILSEIPLLLERKRAVSKSTKGRYFSSFEVEKAEYGDYYGFELSGDKLFLLEDLTVTHNTYSIAQMFVIELMQVTDKVLTISRKTMPALRSSVMRDFFEILKDADLYEDSLHNKSASIYTLHGNMVEFISMDQPQKKRGAKRDYLWLNEANEFVYEDFIQLNMRTTGKVILDYNPSDEFHWIYDKVMPKSVKNCLIAVLSFP